MEIWYHPFWLWKSDRNYFLQQVERNDHKIRKKILCLAGVKRWNCKFFFGCAWSITDYFLLFRPVVYKSELIMIGKWNVRSGLKIAVISWDPVVSEDPDVISSEDSSDILRSCGIGRSWSNPKKVICGWPEPSPVRDGPSEPQSVFILLFLPLLF